MKKSILGRRNLSFLLSLLSLVLLSTSCTAAKMKDYYSQKSNYITVAGTISHIAYSDEKDILYYGFSDVTYQSNSDHHFEYYNFKIVGENFRIVQEKNIDQKVKIGDQITFVAAPRYFYDGYAIPIVAISIGDEEILEFNEGVDNLLKWLE